MKILIGVPTGTGRPHYQAANSIIQAFCEYTFAGHEPALDWEQSALVWKARMGMLNTAINAEVDYLFFLDDDMILAAGQATELLECIQTTEHVAISGLIAQRGIVTRSCISWKHPLGLMDDHDITNMATVEDLKKSRTIEVQGFGLACCLIDMDRFMRAMGPDWNRRDEWQNAFHTINVQENEQHYSMGEDLAFCKRIKDGGGTLGLATQVAPGHLVTAPVYYLDALMDNEIRIRETEKKKQFEQMQKDAASG